MIVRPHDGSVLLMAQPEHAALSAHIMSAWNADGFRDLARLPSTLFAIGNHDNGWIEPDSAPIRDPETGRILDFIHAPDPVRRGVWPLGVARLAGDPYAAALVAQHAISIFGRYQSRADWAPFFSQMESLRSRHLHAAKAPLEELVADYFFLRVYQVSRIRSA